MVEVIFLAIGGALLGSSAIALRIRAINIARNIVNRVERETEYLERLIKRVVLQDNWFIAFATSYVLGKWIVIGAGTVLLIGQLVPNMKVWFFITETIIRWLLK